MSIEHGQPTVMKSVRPHLLALIALVLVAGTLTFGTAKADAAAGQWGVNEEQQFVQKINQLRSSLGLSTLAVDQSLVSQARSWSQVMANEGTIFHSSDLSVGISANWELLGENVGVGGTVESLFQAFVDSPTHYDNLVNPTYDYIGIGVVWVGDRMFTAHRFMAVAAPVVTPPPAPSTTSVPTPPAADTPPQPAPTTTIPRVELPPSKPIKPTAKPEAVAVVIDSLLEGLR